MWTIASYTECQAYTIDITGARHQNSAPIGIDNSAQARTRAREAGHRERERENERERERKQESYDDVMLNEHWAHTERYRLQNFLPRVCVCACACFAHSRILLCTRMIWQTAIHLSLLNKFRGTKWNWLVHIYATWMGNDDNRDK